MQVVVQTRMTQAICMVDFSFTELCMPTTFKPAEHPANGTVGALSYWDVIIDASETVRELLALLDKNTQIPGVVVLEQETLIGLIAREEVYEKLGRPYGVELFLKNSNKQFYESLGKQTLVLDADTLIGDAINMALKRDEKVLYEPLVVSHPNGYRIVTMYCLLIAQQDALRNLYSEVHHLSTTDPLTLINNRRGFFEIVNHHLETVRRLGTQYAALMIDMDNFKNINDRYGHLVGDEVIKSVAQRISMRLGQGGVLGRFGGEEFVIFLMDISKPAALEFAEDLRQDLASFFHVINWFQIRITVSIGISYGEGASHIFDRVLTEADQALYTAKNKGRNKTVIWNENMALSPLGHKNIRAIVSAPVNHTENISTQILQGLLRMLYMRDYETEAHTVRVSEMTLKLAKRLELPDEELEGIQIGALLHDIGKIAIPDKILFKQGKLTDAEWTIMKRHPQYAFDLISSIPLFQHAADIPYCHHEYWNGQGYPRGLKENEIPLAARIFTIVDVWDALSSDRPYRVAWASEEVRDFLKEKSGVLFDPALIPLFLEILD